MATIPVSLLVLTLNESRNLPQCLASVTGLVDEIIVVDSGSDDDTVTIAERAGARVVRHAFETHARQWQWALSQPLVKHEWVLALDADQSLTSDLAAELRQMFAGDVSSLAGAYLNRRQIFRGRWIRHGGYYPKYLLKLFRRDAVSVDASELVDHHFRVTGAVTTLRHDIIEDNRNEADIDVWIAKHNRYAVLQARQERLDAGRPPLAPAPADGSPDDRVRRQKAWWGRMPLFVRPCLYFVYRYFLRLGFLDGREGFIFHVLQGFWYRLLVDINIVEQGGRPRHER